MEEWQKHENRNGTVRHNHIRKHKSHLPAEDVCCAANAKLLFRLAANKLSSLIDKARRKNNNVSFFLRLVRIEVSPFVFTVV